MKKLFFLASLLGLGNAPLIAGQTQDYIVLMNPFSIKESDTEHFINRWKPVAEYMRKQPGFIETELHQGIQEKEKWFNYAKWKSVEDFQRAISTPEFKKLTEKFPGEGKPTLYNSRVMLRTEKWRWITSLEGLQEFHTMRGSMPENILAKDSKSV